MAEKNHIQLTREELIAKIDELQIRLEEAEDTRQAIRNGSVDAVVVWGPEGEQVYTLQGAEHPYRVVVEVMNEGVVTVTDSGTILYANSQFAQMAQKPLQQIVGGTFSDFIICPDKRRYTNFIRGALKKSATIRCGLSRGEEEMPVYVSARALDLEGISCFCAVITDLTEMVAAHETRLRYACILELSNDAIIAKDLNMHITSWNAGAERMYGYTAEEAVGRHVSLIVPPERMDELSQLNERVLKGEHVKHLRSVHVHKDGRHIDVSVVLSQIRDEAGHITGLSSIAEDITKEVAAERVLAQNHVRLEELVKQRTEELENEALKRQDIVNQLEDLTERLQRSNKDLEQFAYVASHDLQEPLRQVTSFIQLLLRKHADIFDTESREYMDFVVDGAAQMQNLITDLLAYSRITAADRLIETVDMQAILDQSLRHLKMALDETQAVVTHDPLPTIQGDRVRLAQVFQNLLANAIKFRGENRPEIHIGAKKQDDRYWLFWVKDNGIGFKPEYKDRIFQLFQRLHTRDKFTGTGIGLAICKRVIEGHGGQIWAESESGQGATFYFTLPA